FDDSIGGWYLTGDLGFIMREQVFVTGRIKEVIIVNGRNYYAHDIEEIVSDTPGVRPGRVVARGGYGCIVGSEQLVLIAERNGPEDRDAQVVSALTQKLVRTYGV